MMSRATSTDEMNRVTAGQISRVVTADEMSRVTADEMSREEQLFCTQVESQPPSQPMELPSYEEATKQPLASCGMGTRFCRQVSFHAPVSFRNLVRQATVHLAGGEENTTEQKTNLWTTIIMFSPFVLTIFSVLIVFLYLLYGSVSG